MSSVTEFGYLRGGDQILRLAIFHRDVGLPLMGLVKATPDGHVLSGKFKIPLLGKTTSRSHPVVCGGRLYIRHNLFLYAYDIKAR